MAGGIAIGVVGSRLLPPVAAAVSGMLRNRAGRDPFDLLINDHREILSIVDNMLQTPGDSTLDRTRQFLMLKRKLAKHAMAEGDVVYPMLEDEANGQMEGDHLYHEHAGMKIALFRMEEQLKSGEDWSGTARSLRDIIGEHAREEEEQVFPKLRQVMGRNKFGKLSAKIHREEALVL